MTKIEIIDATPAMADIVSGICPGPKPFIFDVRDEGGFRRWVLQTPIIRKFMGDNAENYTYLAKSPDDYADGLALCQAVGITGDDDDEGEVIIAKQNASEIFLIAMNADGTRAAIINNPEIHPDFIELPNQGH